MSAFYSIMCNFSLVDDKGIYFQSAELKGDSITLQYDLILCFLNETLCAVALKQKDLRISLR